MAVCEHACHDGLGCKSGKAGSRQTPTAYSPLPQTPLRPERPSPTCKARKSGYGRNYLGELVVEVGIGVAVGVTVEHQDRDVVAVLQTP